VGVELMRDLREVGPPATADELVDLETDVLAGFVLARASAGLADATIRVDVHTLEQVRELFGRPLWEMRPADADRLFATGFRSCAPSTRSGKAATLSVFFRYLELRHKVEIYHRTGHVVECPLDEVNRPPAKPEMMIRIPPTPVEMASFFTGWRSELVTCRKYAPAARNYAACRLMALVGLRINELLHLDLADVHWGLGSFGQLHVRHGKGSRRRGPRARAVPLINDARPLLEWYVRDVWGLFDLDPDAPGAPLFPSERHTLAGGSGRVGDDTLRLGLAGVVDRNLPAWSGRLTPHVLRHFCASTLYLSGMDLLAVQELLGHQWVATTMRYVHVHRSHIEDAWAAGQARAAGRLEGLRA
jgi:site-specific recombinase XerD